MKTFGFLLVLVMAGGVFYGPLLSADDASTVSEFKIRISLDRSTSEVKLACSEGCAWTTSTFACESETACSAVVDGYGIMAPVSKSR